MLFLGPREQHDSIDEESRRADPEIPILGIVYECYILAAS